jgi:Golgi nucleoside diphosphatase
MPARGASATMAWAVAGAIAATMGQPGWALEWGVILDCGSSHTATHIYKWGPGQPMQEFVPPRDAELLQNNTMAMTDPAFVSDAVQLRAYFARLVKQAARWVPADKQATTPIRAYATAGMRLLNAATQESLWVHVRAQLSGPATPFAFLRADDAQTISGNMEGIFAYLAVNFILSGAPAAKTQERVGALDLGGASTQITFASSSGGSIMADAYRAGVGGGTPPDAVYSHSYMRAGQHEAQLRLAAGLASAADGQQQAGGGSTQGGGTHPVSHPCYNVGLNRTFLVRGTPRTFVGTGHYGQCAALMSSMLLHPDYECLQQPCAMAGVYQPAAVRS